jgi:hypothetical protein
MKTRIVWSVAWIIAIICEALSLSITYGADEAAFFEPPLTVSAETSSLGSVIPPGRPEWLVNADAREPGDAWAIVTAGPYPTSMECELALSDAIKTATDEYVNQLLGSNLAASLLQLSGGQLKSQLAGDMLRYEETVNVSVGPRQQIHAKLVFNEAFQRELREKWQQISQFYRLSQIGLLSAVVLSLLATTFGYMKASRTRTGTSALNLQFTAAAAILVIVVAGVTASRWIHWL